MVEPRLKTISLPSAETMRSVIHSGLWHWRRMPERAVRYGLHPAVLGWRWRKRESLFDYVERQPDSQASIEVLRNAYRVDNPLPRNVPRDALSGNGWLWGYAMRDVPQYRVGATYIAHLKDVRLLFFETPEKKDFFPALIGREGQSIEAREMSHRPLHAVQASAGVTSRRLDRATWILERAYHNHSHWLTAHLPKLLLLKNRGELDDLILPERRTPVMDESMRMLGIEPNDYPTFDVGQPLRIENLKLVGTDRFGPDHMRALRRAFAGEREAKPRRKILISRKNSRGRKLLNEDELWPRLREAGFESILMEDLTFAEQVQLMQETKILLAPHGAGLTNMIFLPEGGHVIEMADPGFPNPNFYSLSCALGLNYWLIHAQASRAAHPLDRDLTVDLASLERVLGEVP